LVLLDAEIIVQNGSVPLNSLGAIRKQFGIVEGVFRG
jgi:hypothetical protein